MRTCLLALAALALLGPPGLAAPTPPATPDAAACADAACVARHARALLAAGAPRDAVELLKAARARFADADELALLLAASYLASDNPFWAIRTLDARTAARQPDCADASLRAWAYLRQAALDDASHALDATPCAAAPAAERARADMVRALIATARGDPEAAAAPARAARAADALDPADRAALPDLLRRAAPDLAADLRWRLDVATGYTSNALLGSALDAVASTARAGDTASGMLLLDGWVRFAPWTDTVARPVVEAQVRVTRFFADAVRGLSYADFSGRLGVSLGESPPRLLLAYRPALLLLDEGDRYGAGPLVFFEAHRVELEVELGPHLMVFGGAGRRVFRDAARTRLEADLGVGGALPALIPRVTLLWALSGRHFDAHDPAYDLFGASALVSAQIRLPHALLARVAASASVDAYPDSRGYAVFFPSGGETKRRDVLGKVAVTLWSPPLAGARLGLAYELSRRDSTAALYDFTDHRALVRLGWGGDAFVALPPATDAPLPPIPWGGGDDGGGLGERLQDLLRQDEAVQRASSCAQ